MKGSCCYKLFKIVLTCCFFLLTDGGKAQVKNTPSTTQWVSIFNGADLM
jgi:hypothetical protein